MHHFFFYYCYPKAKDLAMSSFHCIPHPQTQNPVNELSHKLIRPTLNFWGATTAMFGACRPMSPPPPPPPTALFLYFHVHVHTLSMDIHVHSSTNSITNICTHYWCTHIQLTNIHTWTKKHMHEHKYTHTVWCTLMHMHAHTHTHTHKHSIHNAMQSGVIFLETAPGPNATWLNNVVKLLIHSQNHN